MRRRPVVNLEAVLLILLVIANLEMNFTLFFDNLDHFDAMRYFPTLGKLILPHGDLNPLIILGKKFTPIKLILRSTSIFIMLCYLLCDRLLRGRMETILKWLLLAALSFCLVLLPTGLTILARQRGGHHELAHDGGTIQVEEAVKMVLRGRNPYRETYHGTPLEGWRGFTNNAVYHYPYPPMSFLPSVPLHLIFHRILGWFDQRIAYIMYYLAAIAAGAGLARNPVGRRLIAMWLALNPLMNHLFTLGSNDVAPALWLLLALAAFQRGWYGWSGVWLGMAASTKQFAVFAVPFMAVELIRRHGLTDRRHVRFLLGVFLLLAAVNLPLFIASPRDFIQDTVQYASGGLPTSYPIQGFHGYGFASLLLFLGIVPNGNVNYPFWLWQAVFCLPLTGLLLHRQHRNGGVPAMLTGFSYTLLVFMFFSRYLHGNFLAFIIIWPWLAWIGAGESTAPEDVPCAESADM
ncbi:DUF2029 domain-containing protein [bacterium]|nr:DUF2029 domain-containing protein [candidate division CSSED10-310 bacterium]